jgi:hypothetical protein
VQAYLSQYVHADVQSMIFGFYFSFFTFSYELRLTRAEFNTLPSVCNQPVSYSGLDREKMEQGECLRGHLFEILQRCVSDFLSPSSPLEVHRYMFGLEELMYRSFDDLRTITTPRKLAMGANETGSRSGDENCLVVVEQQEEEEAPPLVGTQELELLLFSLALMVMMYQLAVVRMSGGALSDYSLNTLLLRKALAILYCDENRHCSNPIYFQKRKQFARGLLEAFVVTTRASLVINSESGGVLAPNLFEHVLFSGAQMSADEKAALLNEEDTEEGVLYGIQADEDAAGDGEESGDGVEETEEALDAILKDFPEAVQGAQADLDALLAELL